MLFKMENQKFCIAMGSIFRIVKPFVSMILLQFGYAGLIIISTVTLKQGMSHYVLVVYRHVFATVVVAPFAFIFERKVRPKMTVATFLKIMVLGFLEPVLDQNLYFLGLTYTSATFAGAMINVLPALTFIMAIICRIEKVNLKKIHSQAKIIGTVVTLAGAMAMTLYKGPILNLVWSKRHIDHEAHNGKVDHNWIKGTLMLFTSCFGWAAFFVLQSFTLKEYPAEMSLTALICLMGAIQGGAVALVMEHHKGAWSIGWDSRLLAAAYAGIVCSGITYYVQGVVMKERGPVFVTAFNPLCMVIVAVLSSIVLSEVIHLGSVIGALIIAVGLYSVVWGKSKDVTSSESIIEKNGHQELPITKLETDSMKMNSGEPVANMDVLIPIIQTKSPLK